MIDPATHPVSIPSDKMMKIIEAQTEISKIGMDLGMVMAIVTEKSQHLVNAFGAVIELAEKTEMVYRAASGALEHHLGLRISRRGSLSGRCVEKGEVLYSPDVMTDDRVDKNACLKAGIKSMIVIPLLHQKNCVGVLKVASDKSGFFNETDRTILSLISDMVAAIMFHAIQFSMDELFLRATTDSLTGLWNRAKFYDELRQQLSFASRKSMALGVIMLDMDELKQINDTLGHQAGDKAISEFAKRLKKSARDMDTVARLGGDEFAIILPDIKGKNEIKGVITRLLKNLEEPAYREENELQLKASMGFSIFPDDAEPVSELIKIADQRMYEDKKTRKKSRIFSPSKNAFKDAQS